MLARTLARHLRGPAPRATPLPPRLLRISAGSRAPLSRTMRAHYAHGAHDAGATRMYCARGAGAPGKKKKEEVAGVGVGVPRLHMVFTCARCETRAAKSFAKRSYEEGVVIVTCPGCGGRHVVADNLGWFGEERNVEEVLAKRGESVVRITDEDVDFSP